MDALEALDRLIKGEGLTFSNGETVCLNDFAAFHASPPCQGYSITNNIVSCRDKIYPKLIGEVRKLLEQTGKPFVIENVVGAPLNYSVVLCGLMFELKVLRHRLFEANFYCMQPGHPYHRDTEIGKKGFCCVVAHSAVKGNSNYQYPNHKVLWQAAMKIDWMTKYEMTQAIPPDYTEYIGKYLLKAVERAK
jgi:DNA (cytosine-5)-methyltransferase 1